MIVLLHGRGTFLADQSPFAGPIKSVEYWIAFAIGLPDPVAE